MTMPSLLAVDLGIKTGLALFGRDGRLRWYRSRNLGNAARLRRAVPRLLDDISDVTHVVLEGGGSLANIWEHEAERRGIFARCIAAEQWREALLYPRERRGTRQAKHSADDLARKVIEWSEAPRPTSLRHDAAEAVLIGLWGVLEIGWLGVLPDPLRK
jgi:hypothetical protein